MEEKWWLDLAEEILITYKYGLSKGCPPGAGAKGPVHYPYPVNAHTEILFLPQGH